MTANIKMLNKALRAIKKYPDNHNQASWISFGTEEIEPDEYYNEVNKSGSSPVQADNSDHPECGTTMCMAGWIVFQNAPSGTKMIYDRTRNDDDYVGPQMYVVLPDGTETEVEPYAKELAELNHSQASSLFYSAGDFEELKDTVKRIKDGVL